MARPKKIDRTQRSKAPAKTLDAREKQLVALAVDLAEKQLSAGTASSQVIVHYLRLGSTRERLEKEKLARENKLIEAKTGAIESAKKVEELYTNALGAMQSYKGMQKEESENADDSEE